MPKQEMNLKPTSNIEYVEPEEGMLITYSNNVNFGFTVGDMRLIFGELIDTQQDKATIEQRAQVTLSWTTAKILSETLAALVAQHEKQFGSIPFTPEMLQIKNIGQ